MLPHFLYGPGEDALQLTREYQKSKLSSALNKTYWKDDRDEKFLCLPNQNRSIECDETDGNYFTRIILFVAQLCGGAGSALFNTLGISYMDDNIKKSKTPALISFSYFLRLLGPAFGFGLASFSLKFYINPALKIGRAHV